MVRRALGVGLILAVAAAVRVYGVGRESVWLDEAFSIEIARTTVSTIIDETAVDVHPPFYYVLLHYWMKLAGGGEVSARLLSVLASVGTLAAAMALASRLFGFTTALLTGLLLALSPFQVEYAHEARMYALLAFLATLSMHALVTFAERERLSPAAGYVAATAAMLYTHAAAVFVLLAQGITIVWLIGRGHPFARRVVAAWTLAIVAVALLYVPWMPFLTAQLARVRGEFWIAKPEVIDVFSPIASYAGSSLPLALVLTALAILGMKSAFATHDGHRANPGIVLLPWLVIPIVVPFVLSFTGRPIFLPKYTIAASVPFAIAAAHGLAALARWRHAAVVATTAAVALSAVTLESFHTTPRKDGWREAVAALEGVARPGDRLLFYKGFNQKAYDFYRQRSDLVERALTDEIFVDIPPPGTLRALVDDGVAGAPRVWLVMLQNDPIGEELIGTFRSVMPQVSRTNVRRVELVLFERVDAVEQADPRADFAPGDGLGYPPRVP